MALDRHQRAALFGKKPRRDDEDQLQIAVVEHLRLRARPGVVWYMIPNGTNKSRAQAAKAKAMGLRRGASDMGFILPPNGQAAMLELKTGKNTASAEQEQYGAETEAAGGLFAVAWDIDQALAVLEAWGVIHPESQF